MAFEFNMKSLFQDFNPSKFVVYSSLLIFSLLFALRLDATIMWSFWIIFLPLWIWKAIAVVGAIIGIWVWCRNPHYRKEIDSSVQLIQAAILLWQESDSSVQFKAMIIATSLHILLLFFEFLACDKLDNYRPQMLWILICIPLFCISIISIGLCVWALKHGRAFELELFCSVNILQFIFFALRLDEFIKWRWVIVFIPVWIVMCVALVGVIYAIILAIILYKSSDIVAEQRRGNVMSAIGYTLTVISLLVFEILLVNKIDGVEDMPYIYVTMPLLFALCVLMLMSFGARTGNQWWFGVRKEFCCWLLAVCPLLQEYGNISYKVQSDQQRQDYEPPGDPEATNTRSERSASHKSRFADAHSKKRRHMEDAARTMVPPPVVSLELPD